jgi:hypothetical protein
MVLRDFGFRESGFRLFVGHQVIDFGERRLQAVTRKVRMLR